MEFVVSGGNKPTNYEVKITSLTSASSSYTYSGTYNQSPQVVSFDAKDKIPVLLPGLTAWIKSKTRFKHKIDDYNGIIKIFL